MRRLATAVPTALVTVAAVLTLSTGTALAHGQEHGGGHGRDSASSEHHHGKKGEKAEKPKRVKPLITLTGVLSDTPTATIGGASDTATSTIRILVRGGERTLHAAMVLVTVDSSTIVRRGDRSAAVTDLRKGDLVSLRARRMPDGSLLALRVNASGPRREDADNRDDDRD